MLQQALFGLRENLDLTTGSRYSFAASDRIRLQFLHSAILSKSSIRSYARLGYLPYTHYCLPQLQSPLCSVLLPRASREWYQSHVHACCGTIVLFHLDTLTTNDAL